MILTEDTLTEDTLTEDTLRILWLRILWLRIICGYSDWGYSEVTLTEDTLTEDTLTEDILSEDTLKILLLRILWLRILWLRIIWLGILWGYSDWGYSEDTLTEDTLTVDTMTEDTLAVDTLTEDTLTEVSLYSDWGFPVFFPQLESKCQSINRQRRGPDRISVSFRHIVRKGTICYYVHCLVLWVILRFNWMMYCCHRVSTQLRQYEIIINNNIYVAGHNEQTLWGQWISAHVSAISSFRRDGNENSALLD